MGCGSSKPVRAVKKPIIAVGETMQTGVNAVNPFVPTGDVTSRCNVMLKEASDFGVTLKRVEKDWKAFNKAAENTLDSTGFLLNHNKPHVYEDADAATEVLKAQHALGGPDFSFDEFTKARTDFGVNVQAEGIGPVSQWLARYDDAVAKQKLVDKAYDEIVSAKRKVDAQKQKLMDLQYKSTTSTRASNHIPEVQRHLQSLEDKLQIATNKHNVEEEAQFSRLCALSKDAISLRDTLRAGLEQAGRGLLQARQTIPVGTPSFSLAGVPTASPEGISAIKPGRISPGISPANGDHAFSPVSPEVTAIRPGRVDTAAGTPAGSPTASSPASAAVSAGPSPADTPKKEVTVKSVPTSFPVPASPMATY